MEKMMIIIMMIIRLKEMCECCLESERNGLLQIKSSSPPQSSSFFSTWVTSDGSDCCNWEGVHCDFSTDHVSVLDIRFKRDDNLEDFKWYLNASLFLPFPQLNELFLWGNNIAGCIQNEGFERLSTLVNLEVLYLTDNYFNNSILQSLSVLPSLKYLALYNNNLKGTINISEWNNLTTTLEDLDLSGNEIEGFETEVKLKKLEYLNLGNNHFNSNSSLSALRGISSLKALDMQHNQFKGHFNFTELDGLSNLQELDLSSNEITRFIISRGVADLRGPSDLSILHLDAMNSTEGIRNLMQQSSQQWLHLKTLSLIDNNFEGVQIFGNESVFKSLENLYLNDSSLDLNSLQNIGVVRSLKTLSLPRCRLSAKIPASHGLCDLKHLQQLHMQYNDLNGDLPLCFANLTSLRLLDLSYNQFTGNLSPLQSLTSLQYLYLSDNLLEIPVSLTPLFNISKLKILYVGNNSIYADAKDQNSNPKFQLEEVSMIGYGEGGAIPKFLYHQRNLRSVTICSIKLRGRFPYWLLENNTRLQTLYLRNNSLSGNLQLPNTPHMNLAELDISGNFFTGYIPSQIGLYFPSLGALDMSTNEFKGSIPDSVCNSYVLDASENNISGEIPKCIGNTSRLQVLDLSNNNVSGSLPSKFGPSYIVVKLSRNRLKGSLKDAFNSCFYLSLLDLAHNNFSGSIPSWIGELSELRFLVLGHNNFQGEIPAELCKLKHLSLLDFSHNHISGHIPPSLNLTAFSSTGYSEVFGVRLVVPLEFTVKGTTYLYQITILTYMSGIDLSSNNLTGQIPFEIGYLSNIKALNLSHNSLTGRIPPTFSNLKGTESLDLSFNNLQGTIPYQLTQLTSLEVFNVSCNNLSGPIPDKVAQFATFDESSYRGNPFLCGGPLSKSCTAADSLPTSPKHSPYDEESSSSSFIDMEDFYVSFGIGYGIVLMVLVAVLCINPYWRRVWFYYIQMSIDKTRYFIIDNVIPLFSRFS